MKHYFAKTEREDVFIDFIDALYISNCEMFNKLSPADCGISGGEIEDGIAQTHNRLIALLEGVTRQEEENHG